MKVATKTEITTTSTSTLDNVQINCCSIFYYSDAVRNYLSRSAWPKGLQNVFIQGIQTIPTRFIICDDSGSMMSNDGHRVVSQGSKARWDQYQLCLYKTPQFPDIMKLAIFLLRLIGCSRWTEMTESLRFHVGLASAAGAPTEFRLLNGRTIFFSQKLFCRPLLQSVRTFFLNNLPSVMLLISLLHRYFWPSSSYWTRFFLKVLLL